MALLAGNILFEDGEAEGWVEVEEGLVVATGDGPAPDLPDAEGWITPAPVNAHTHVGDAFLRGARGMPTRLPELVGPGGWKHRQLAMARRGRAGRGVHRYTSEMAEIGTTHFLDFRENGVVGSQFLRDLEIEEPWTQEEQLGPLPVQPIIFGRPAMHDFDPDEAEELFDVVDGIGLSALRDFPDAQDATYWSQAAHDAGIPLALHVSEERHENLEEVLALDPAFVVHMTHGLGGDFQRLADQQVPTVVCPRSNRFFGMKTPIRALLDAGCHVAIGTDNGMLQDGDLIQELALLRQWEPSIPETTLLRCLTFGGRALIGDLSWPPQEGDPAPAVLPQVPAYATA